MRQSTKWSQEFSCKNRDMETYMEQHGETFATSFTSSKRTFDIYLPCRKDTKSTVEFLRPFSTFAHLIIYAFGSMHLLDSSSYSHLPSLIFASAAKKNKTRQEKRIQANASSKSTFRPVLSSYWSNARMGTSSNPDKSPRSVFDNNSVGN
jgi:hypothetical protein